MSKERPNKLHLLIEGGAEIAGGAAAGVLGYFAGDPATALAFGASGSAASLAVKRIGEEISHRILAPREAVRAGGVLALAMQRIQLRLDRGDKVRADAFLSQSSHHRCGADEVFESVVAKSMREVEEKKIPFLANLLANSAFDERLDIHMAHQLISAAEQLRYRQLCILCLAAQTNDVRLRDSHYARVGEIPPALYSLLLDCHDAYVKGFISFGGNKSLSLMELTPMNMRLDQLGLVLYDAMSLEKLPDEDVRPIRLQLSSRDPENVWS